MSRRQIVLPGLVIALALIVVAGSAFVVISDFSADASDDAAAAHAAENTVVDGEETIITDEKGRAIEIDGQRIRMEDPPSEEEISRMDVRSHPADLVVESVGLRAQMRSMREVGGVINPPGLAHAYLLRGYGTPEDPELGTIYIAMHSVQGATLPGNKLIDVAQARSAVVPGDRITVADRQFAVTEAFTIGKSEISTRTDIWESTPGRLVLLTCLQRPSGRSVQNVVVVAEQI